MESEPSKPSDNNSSTTLQASSVSTKALVLDDTGNNSMSVDPVSSVSLAPSSSNSSSSTDSGRRSTAVTSPAVTNGCSSGSSSSTTSPPTGGTVCVGGDNATTSGTVAVGEQFLQLAKSAKGAAAVQLLKEALEAPGLYVFAELLHMPNIKELSSVPEHSAYYRLVEVFAYGVYDDYLSSSPPLPPLSQTMLTKLRHLTIVTMANTAKSLPLDNLVKKLGLNSRRELEDLIIEAIYADVLHGKLDQRDGVLEVDYAVGRDIKLQDLTHIATTLKAWCDTCNGLLGTLEDLVIHANRDKEASIRRVNNIEAEITKIKSNFKRQVGGGGGDGADDGISQTDAIRDAEKKLHRLKKSSSGQAGGSGMAKSTAKFWPKS